MKRTVSALMIFLLCLFLPACANGDSTPADTALSRSPVTEQTASPPAVSEAPEKTAPPTATPSPSVQPTEPPEPTPTATPTPTPTPTPVPTPEPTPNSTLSPAPTSAPTPVSTPTPEPTTTPVPDKEYVLNTNTMKFHKPSCSSVKDIKPKNYQEFTGTRDQVIRMGYDPCKRCNP